MTTELVEDRQRGFKPDNLHALFENLKRYHATRVGNQERWDAKYYQDVTWARAHVPGDVKIFQSSQATDVVDTIADQIRTDEPVIHFTTVRDTEKSRTHRTLMETWASEQMEHDRLHAEIDPYSQASKDQPLRGEGVFKQLHNPDRPEEPVRADFDSTDDFEQAHSRWEAEMADYQPLLPTRVVDPLNVYLPPNARSPLPYILEHQKRTAIDMWRDYPGWQDMLGNRLPTGSAISASDRRNPAREVDWLEFWSPDHYIVEADGVRIIDRKNPYGFVPYWHEYSGMGRSDRQSGSDRKAIGILGKIEGEIEGDIMMRTITFAAATQYVFPRILAPEGEVDRVAGSLAQRSVIPYNTSNPLGPKSIQWLESPDLKPEVAQFLGQVQDAIARRVSPSLTGTPTNAQSGVQEALRIGQNTKGQSDIVEAVNNMATGLVNMKARMMKALDLDITLKNGKKLNGDDFADPNFEVQFNAFDEIEDARQQQSGLTLMRENAITRRTFRTKYASRIIDDPEEEEIQEGVEAAWDAWLASPQFQQWAVQQHMGEQAVQAEEDSAATGRGSGGPSDAQRAESLALLDQLAPTTPLNSLNGATQILNGGQPNAI